MCAYGLACPDTSLPIQKATGIMCHFHGAANYDGLKTCPGCERHRAIEGKLSSGQNVSTFCAEYTHQFVSSMMDMCQPFVKAVAQHQTEILLSEMHDECLAGELASSPEIAAQPSPMFQVQLMHQSPNQLNWPSRSCTTTWDIRAPKIWFAFSGTVMHRLPL